jgi:hypothetical protein
VELDAIPYMLLVVRHADDSSPRELPAELAAAAVEVTEDQVNFSRTFPLVPHSSSSTPGRSRLSSGLIEY